MWIDLNILFVLFLIRLLDRELWLKKLNFNIVVVGDLDVSVYKLYYFILIFFFVNMLIYSISYLGNLN